MLKIAQFLNLYGNLCIVLSNVLLVVLTGIYVWLTGRTLRSLNQASLREREARHLQEIKDYVILPITSWIEQTVIQRFVGKTPRLLTLGAGDRGEPLRVGHTIDDPFASFQPLKTSADPVGLNPLETWTSTEGGRVSSFLYNHTKKVHFPEELQEFDRLLENVGQVTADIIVFTRQFAKHIAEGELRLAPPALCFDDQNSMPEWVNYHLFVTECVHSFLVGRSDAVFSVVKIFGKPARLTADLSNGTLVGQAADEDKLRLWQEAVYTEVRSRWATKHMDTRIRHLLRQANATRRNMGHISFTHSFGVDCDLVSGAKH